MGFLSSNSVVRVFPSARRVGHEITSRNFTETNIINLITSLVDKDSFVVSPNSADNSASNWSYSSSITLIFCIGGYYFEITDTVKNIVEAAGGSDEQNSTVWVSINLTDVSDLVGKELSGQDDNNEYKGLTLTNTEPTSGFYRKLKILTKVDTKYKVPTESYIKINASSVNNSNMIIDGGRLTFN